MKQMLPIGKEIYYLHICRRKLWLFNHGIRPEMENDHVRIGMLIQQTSFSREKKEIPIGEIGVLDWADFKDGIIHETKKGRTCSSADRAQVAYYMWFLIANGVAVREAQIHYPAVRKTDRVVWSDEIAKSVQKDLEECRRVCQMETPPSVPSFSICRDCAYQEICCI